VGDAAPIDAPNMPPLRPVQAPAIRPIPQVAQLVRLTNYSATNQETRAKGITYA
jgi:hypothetical protein